LGEQVCLFCHIFIFTIPLAGGIKAGLFYAKLSESNKTPACMYASTHIRK